MPRIIATRRRWWLTLLVIAVAAVLLRAALPALARSAANAGLASLENYVGEVGTVDMILSRGIFIFEDFELARRQGRGPDFIRARRITVDVRLRELMRWHGVVDLHVEEPAIELIWNPDPNRRQLGERLRWAEFIDALPIAVDRIRAERGLLTMQGLGNVDSRIDIAGIDLSIVGMVPVGAEDEAARVDRALNVDPPAAVDEPTGAIEFSARVFDTAPLQGGGRFTPDLSQFVIDLWMNVDDLPLSAVNPWLEEFTGLDVARGGMRLAAEIGLADGRLRGETTLAIDDASFVGDDDEDGGLFARAWERVASFGLTLLQGRDARLARTFPINAELVLPADPDLRQIVLTLIAARREGFGQPPDDPARVLPPAWDELDSR